MLRTWLLAIFSICLSACSGLATNSPSFETEFSPPAFSDAAIDEAVMAKWSRSCALCHITGEAGAPVVGDSGEWRRRLQQGEQVVMTHVLEGFNSMPPLGYCMACELADFRAMIAYMAGPER